MQVCRGAMWAEMRALLAAVQFLTTLPIPGEHAISDTDWGRATAWYPLVGLVLGVILVGLDWLAQAFN